MLNKLTVILIQFVFICTKIYEADITASYLQLNVKMFLPFFIHFLLVLNMAYNYLFLFLQIRASIRGFPGELLPPNNKVENDLEQSDSQSQIYKTQPKKMSLKNVVKDDFSDIPADDSQKRD